METISTTHFYQFIINLIEFLSIVGQGLCLIYFLEAFLSEKYFSKTGRCFSSLLIYILFWYGNDLFKEMLGEFHMLRNTIFTFLAIGLIIRLFYFADTHIASFLVITFTAICGISKFITYTIVFYSGEVIELWSAWYWDNALMPSAVFFLSCIEWFMTAILLLQQLAMISLLFFSLKKIKKEFRGDIQSIRKEEWQFLLFPGITALLLCIMMNLIIIHYSQEGPEQLYLKHPLLPILVPLIMVFCLFSILSGVKLFQDMLGLEQEKNSRLLLEKQLNTLQKQTTEMERLYSGFKSLKHDMKNTVSVLLQLTNEASRDSLPGKEVEAYLSRLKENMDAFDTEFHTGNRIVDTLLKMKQYEISCRYPDLSLDADGLLFSAGLSIEGYDLAIILGNALDNAIEACHRLRESRPDAELFIHLSSFQKNGLFFLEVSNSFDGKVLNSTDREFPKSSKPDTSMHGIGMVNMKTVALKYDGEIDWTANGEIFQLIVMMKG